jgi:sortase A
MKKSENRFLVWMEFFLLGASLSALAIWAASLVIPAVWEYWANQSFDRAVQESGPAQSSTPAPSPAPAPSLRIPSIQTNDLVGRLSIPRLDLSAMVREGDTETTLSLALGHIPGTALPGQTGNVGVAGHRDALFRGLRYIRKDDLIKFETVKANYLYRVEDMEIVKPEQVSVLQARDYSELTLVTCYPFYFVGSAPERFIVKARAVTSARTPRAQNAAIKTY